MSYSKRKQKYEMLVQKRGCPLIVYVTSIRPNLSANMAGDAIPQIIEQIELIPEEVKEIDFIIISNGGDPITALRIMSLLRERFDKITVTLRITIMDMLLEEEKLKISDFRLPFQIKKRKRFYGKFGKTLMPK